MAELDQQIHSRAWYPSFKGRYKFSPTKGDLMKNDLKMYLFGNINTTKKMEKKNELM